MNWFLGIVILWATLTWLTEINGQFIGVGLRAVIVYIFLLVIFSLNKSLWNSSLLRGMFYLLVPYLLFYPFFIGLISSLLGYSELDFEFEIKWENLIATLYSTNSNETIEYIFDHIKEILYYIGKWSFSVVIAILGGRYLISKSHFTINKLYVYAFLLVWLWGYLFNNLIKETHIVPNIVEGAKAFNRQLKQLSKLENGGENPIDFPFKKTIDEGNRTVVVIIGESETRLNMSLYGYHRDTTPRLKSRSQNLLIYENAISTAFNTIPSITHALSNCFQSSKNWYQYSNVITIAHKLGYHVTWLTNQPLLGDWDTPVGFIANQADKVVGINISGIQGGRYDEDLLPFFERSLKEPFHRKLIFIHLMGSHGTYSRRYPPKFQLSANDRVTAELQKRNVPNWIIKERLNYDSSINYTDYVVDRIISTVEKINSKDAYNFIVFFSDHGQDVGHFSKERVGHSHQPSGFMIPLVLWPKDVVVERFPAVHENISKLVGLDSIHLLISSLLGAEFVKDEKSNPLSQQYSRNRVILDDGRVIESEQFLGKFRKYESSH